MGWLMRRFGLLLLLAIPVVGDDDDESAIEIEKLALSSPPSSVVALTRPETSPSRSSE